MIRVWLGLLFYAMKIGFVAGKSARVLSFRQRRRATDGLREKERRVAGDETAGF